MKNNHALRFGILAGIGTVLFLFIFYWIEKRLMLSPSIVWSTILLYVLGMYMAPIEEKKENNGILPFKPALKSAFQVFIIANAIYHLYNYALYNFIDTDMLNVQKQYMTENLEEMEGLLGEEATETFLEGLEQLNYNFFSVITAYVSSLIGGFILAAIIARFVRVNPLEEEMT